MCINAYIKEGTSTHTTQSAMAKCEYKIKVQKTPPCERMEGEGYRLKRKNSDMRPPVVRLVMPGLFAQWLTANGKWGGQHKMPRCRSDRAIADVFASLAQFNK